ncbi:hypothetical protein CAC42_857 [Sphaceloma murrayae]|uniref:Uncharacterized protein n=1 Tax=Sphaceloma murrayae TaxID=2082308 RepID=A0A2K1QKB1_9PEZI|nr:hypothetical protein CAC42_857 [Sphaceloma murrayae]
MSEISRAYRAEIEDAPDLIYATAPFLRDHVRTVTSLLAVALSRRVFSDEVLPIICSETEFWFLGIYALDHFLDRLPHKLRLLLRNVKVFAFWRSNWTDSPCHHQFLQWVTLLMTAVILPPQLKLHIFFSHTVFDLDRKLDTIRDAIKLGTVRFEVSVSLPHIVRSSGIAFWIDENYTTLWPDLKLDQRLRVLWGPTGTDNAKKLLRKD